MVRSCRSRAFFVWPDSDKAVPQDTYQSDLSHSWRLSKSGRSRMLGSVLRGKCYDGFVVVPGSLEPLG